MEAELGLLRRNVGDVKLRSDATYPYVDGVSSGKLPEKGNHGCDKIVACVAPSQGIYTVVAVHVEFDAGTCGEFQIHPQEVYWGRKDPIRKFYSWYGNATTTRADHAQPSKTV